MVNGINKLIILQHHLENTTGMPQFFAKYLNEKKVHIFDFQFPFYYSSSKAVHKIEYRDGDIVTSHNSWIRFYKPIYLSYIKDVILAFVYMLQVGFRSNLVLCTSNILALVALFFRKIGWVEKVVYLVVDYSPDRFGNQFLNKIYQMIDKFVLYRVSSAWVMNLKMLDGRKRDWNLNLDLIKAQEVPWGNHSDQLDDSIFSEYNKNEFVFIGNPNGKNINADLLVPIAKELKHLGLESFTFHLIGPGDTSKIKEYANNSGVDKNFIFHGLIPNISDVELILRKCSFGLAPYDTNVEDSFTKYADPAKIKTYLGSSLPIILTSVPPIAVDLMDKKAGIIVDYDAKSFASVLFRFQNDTAGYVELRKNALNFGRQFSWTKIFDKAIDSLNVKEGN